MKNQLSVTKLAVEVDHQILVVQGLDSECSVLENQLKDLSYLIHLQWLLVSIDTNIGYKKDEVVVEMKQEECTIEQEITTFESHTLSFDLYFHLLELYCSKYNWVISQS